MENQESTEDNTVKDNNSTDKKVSNKADSKKKAKKSDNNKKSDSKPKYHCSHHGDNWTHNTEDCNALKKQKEQGSFGNKTWNRKANEANEQ